MIKETVSQKTFEFASSNSSHGKREKKDSKMEYKKGSSRKKEKARMPKTRKVGK